MAKGKPGLSEVERAERCSRDRERRQRAAEELLSSERSAREAWRIGASLGVDGCCAADSARPGLACRAVVHHGRVRAAWHGQARD
jgi:hypothetical protein